MKTTKRQGYTLVELFVVIAGFLALLLGSVLFFVIVRALWAIGSH